MDRILTGRYGSRQLNRTSTRAATSGPQRSCRATPLLQSNSPPPSDQEVARGSAQPLDESAASDIRDASRIQFACSAHAKCVIILATSSLMWSRALSLFVRPTFAI